MTDSEHTLIIGVDGGGTGCRVAIGTLRQGVLAQAEGGRANATSNPDLALKNVVTATHEAAQKAGLSIEAISDAIAHVGLAGVMTEADSARIAAGLPFASCAVTDDRPTTIAGALGDKDGFLLSIGTGTIVASSKAGHFAFIGGWGFQISDQSSGAWLGHKAIRRTVLCHDGLSPHSDLTREVMGKFENDPNAIVQFAATAAPGDYATLAPLVIAAGEADDFWGAAIMTEGAAYLSKALGALDFRTSDTLCLTGGVGPHYARYLSPDITKGRTTSKGGALDGAFQLATNLARTNEGNAS